MKLLGWAVPTIHPSRQLGTLNPFLNYLKRVGLLKGLFTRSLRGRDALPQAVCLSRQRQREGDVWQRRFWEHQIRDEADWMGHLNYLPYNPVKHGLVRCPYEWEFASFRWFVGEGLDVGE